MEIFIIILLILLNGIFAMSEISLVSSRKFKLENLKKKGNKGAKVALEMSDNPTRFFSTVQIGITLIGILLGVYSGDNLTDNVQSFLERFELLRPYAKNLAVAFMVIFITYLSIILGELFPKRVGMTFPEKIVTKIAIPMKVLSQITSPFVLLLTFSNDILLKIFGIKKTTDSKVSEEEIKAIIKESADGGEIQDIEQSIVERVFELGDRKVNSLFTHRNEIVFFDVDDTWDEIRRKINEEKHSAYPVCKNNDLNELIGIVLLKDLFFSFDAEEFKIADYVKDPIYINESTYAYKVLELFKEEGMHYGIVVDEYGSVEGIVTMDDVVDALVGDVTEIDQNEYKIVEREAGGWLVDGQYSLIEFVKFFDLQIDTEILSKYNTVAGLLIHISNVLPEIGKIFEVDNYTLEVIDKDNQRIDKILVTRID